jgi:hypothetical protein
MEDLGQALQGPHLQGTHPARFLAGLAGNLSSYEAGERLPTWETPCGREAPSGKFGLCVR